MGDPNGARHDPPLHAGETLYRLPHRQRLTTSVRPPQDTMKKLKVHAILSTLIIVIGVVLMIYMIFVEDEPGGIPLLLIVFGMGWYFITRVRIRSHHK